MSVVPTVAMKFQQLRDEVIQIITTEDQKHGNAPSTVIESGRHLLIAIENAKNIFAVHLKSPFHTDPVLYAKFNDFDKMVECLRKTNYCRLNLPSRIRHSIDTGTIDGNVPKLYNVYPQYLVPHETLIAKFFGKFKQAGKYPPKFQIGNHIFKLIKAEHYELTFALDTKANPFPFIQDKRCLLHGTLEVPFASKWLTSDVPFKFEVLVGILPVCPGNLHVSFGKLDIKGVLRRTQITATNIIKRALFSSSNEKVVTFPPTPGWMISPDKVKILKHAKLEDEFLFDLKTDDNSITVRVTPNESKKSQCDAEFHVEFEEWKNDMQEVIRTEKLEIKWDEVKQLIPLQGERFVKVDFQSFDSSKPTSLDKPAAIPYFQLGNQGDNWFVKTTGPSDL